MCDLAHSTITPWQPGVLRNFRKKAGDRESEFSGCGGVFCSASSEWVSGSVGSSPSSLILAGCWRWVGDGPPRCALTDARALRTPPLENETHGKSYRETTLGVKHHLFPSLSATDLHSTPQWQMPVTYCFDAARTTTMNKKQLFKTFICKWQKKITCSATILWKFFSIL